MQSLLPLIQLQRHTLHLILLLRLSLNTLSLYRPQLRLLLIAMRLLHHKSLEQRLHVTLNGRRRNGQGVQTNVLRRGRDRFIPCQRSVSRRRFLSIRLIVRSMHVVLAELHRRHARGDVEAVTDALHG